MASRSGRYTIDLKDLDAEIKRIAEEEDRTYSGMIKKLLKEALAARKTKI